MGAGLIIFFKLPNFVKENPPLALFALLSTATSGFGQTFFVSVFGPGIRQSFELSNSAYGAFYGAATLGSALLLLKLGSLVDRWALTRVTLLAVTLLAVTLLASGCLTLFLAGHWLLLLPGFLLIRFGGQGMMPHLGMSVASRYFRYSRGRIMALTAAGFPLAEALLPAGAGFVLVRYGWRLPWLLALVVLLLLALPLLYVLARHAAHPARVAEGQQQQTGGGSFTRGQALRDPGFYGVLPAALVTPFTVTALLFHQGAIAQLRNWSPQLMATAFSGFALGHVCSLFVAGPLVDRWGAQRSLALALSPLVVGLLVLAGSDAVWTPYLYLACVGLTLGGSSAAASAMWPERYGVRHIGAIRAVAQAALVFSTAVAPVVMGLLLDAGLSPAQLALTLAALVVASGLLLVQVKKAPAKS